MLPHRLQQGGLGARGRAVDLVGEQDVRERRAGAELEFECLLIEDRDADDIVGQEVGRKLNAVKVQTERDRDGPREHGLAGAGHVLEEQMAFAQERDHHQFDHVALADDDLLDVVGDGRAELANLAYIHHA